jgi:hypothetical protein
MIHVGLFIIPVLFSNQVSPRFCGQAEDIAYYEAINFTTKGTEEDL